VKIVATAIASQKFTLVLAAMPDSEGGADFEPPGASQKPRRVIVSHFDRLIATIDAVDNKVLFPQKVADLAGTCFRMKNSSFVK
jgi:hypothetical protein